MNKDLVCSSLQAAPVAPCAATDQRLRGARRRPTTVQTRAGGRWHGSAQPCRTRSSARTRDPAMAGDWYPAKNAPDSDPVTAAQAALLRSPTRPPHLGSRPGPEPGLSFGLIHPHPGPFTDVHADRVRAARGRWRTPVNAMQHCWKACWGQPLRSSNLLSSATLTCDDTLESCSRAAIHRQRVSHFLSQFESWPYALFRTNRCGGTLR